MGSHCVMDNSCKEESTVRATLGYTRGHWYSLKVILLTVYQHKTWLMLYSLQVQWSTITGQHASGLSHNATSISLVINTVLAYTTIAHMAYYAGQWSSNGTVLLNSGYVYIYLGIYLAIHEASLLCLSESFIVQWDPMCKKCTIT